MGICKYSWPWKTWVWTAWVHLCGFFSINTVLFFIHSWASADVEGWLYTVLYAILYRGLEHPWIWVSAECPRTNPLQILRNNLRLGGVKVILRYFTAQGIGAHNPHIVPRVNCSYFCLYPKVVWLLVWLLSIVTSLPPEKGQGLVGVCCEEEKRKSCSLGRLKEKVCYFFS